MIHWKGWAEYWTFCLVLGLFIGVVVLVRRFLNRL